ncbi:type II toxin-antitoxin system HigB family toxin [Nitrospira sp. NS4]|uniref:type II toxin-antitoxin system HigB family toxin n=1 Tax=Nitrospira sp. NS4 TaxID=3414498 RepID=UPI003C2D4A1F
MDVTRRHRRVRVALIALSIERPRTGAIRTDHNFRNDGRINRHERTIAGSSSQVQGAQVFKGVRIGGNEFRLIASIHYNRKKLYIRHILTHAEYDRNTWRS